MRSTAEIAAERSSDGSGRTVVRRARAGGHLAVRETGPGVVHLVGTAAGPIGGDEVELRIDVGPGARLAVRGVAATLVYPARDVATSAIRVVAYVADGGALDLAPEPVIVCAGADLMTSTRVTLAGSATLRLLEEVVLGRAHEPPGRWRGRTVVTRAGVPVVSHTLRSDLLGPPGAPESKGGQETRVVVTLLAVGPGAGEVRPAVAGRRAAVLPLAAAGAVLTTATGADLPTARAELAALTGAAVYA